MLWRMDGWTRWSAIESYKSIKQDRVAPIGKWMLGNHMECPVNLQVPKGRGQENVKYITGVWTQRWSKYRTAVREITQVHAMSMQNYRSIDLTFSCASNKVIIVSAKYHMHMCRSSISFMNSIDIGIFPYFFLLFTYNMRSSCYLLSCGYK